MEKPGNLPPYPFTFSLGSAARVSQSKAGEIRIADSEDFVVSKTIAAGLITLRPGAMREMHWHPNADEWQYWIKGTAQMTVFEPGPRAKTLNFTPGDIGYVNRNNSHYIKNIGDGDAQFLAVFRSSYYRETSLSSLLAKVPPEMVAQTLNIDEATIAKFPKDRLLTMPE
jgi:oxalate decarboxylase